MVTFWIRFCIILTIYLYYLFVCFCHSLNTLNKPPFASHLIAIVCGFFIPPKTVFSLSRTNSYKHSIESVYNFELDFQISWHYRSRSTRYQKIDGALRHIRTTHEHKLRIEQSTNQIKVLPVCLHWRLRHWWLIVIYLSNRKFFGLYLLFISYVWQPFSHTHSLLLFFFFCWKSHFGGKSHFGAFSHLFSVSRAYDSYLALIRTTFIGWVNGFSTPIQSNFPMCHIFTTYNEHTKYFQIMALTCFPITILTKAFHQLIRNWCLLTHDEYGVCLSVWFISFVLYTFFLSVGSACNNVEK